MKPGKFGDLDRKVLAALAKGPLYRPELEVLLGINETQSQRTLLRLKEDGKVELAPDIGPATYRLTEGK